ncbi:ABC transporter substrate-binding protein [Butyrivibrio sp. NC3005]|uniref:ABC transporter substrate-binding protein n=1 Tax=Butyrivibrio sp. NC3005 TaxID=1280685 RepID=UPI0003FBC38D|nr:ABC transporter substrate-binding protein [Butyrivibrio sp. NC3005]
MKKLIAIFCAITSVFFITSCQLSKEIQVENDSSIAMSYEETTYIESTVVGSDIVYHKSNDITSDKITLTYFNFDQREITNYLANRFMQIYPNITVKNYYESVSSYDDTLLTMVSNGETPDVIMYSDADFALSNMLLGDITDFWNKDPETKNLLPTINSAGLGCFGTSRRYAVPVKFFPGIIYIDRNVLNKLGIAEPDTGWNWEEMIYLIKDATYTDENQKKYYGCGCANRLDSYYGIAYSDKIIGELGFDGRRFNLEGWAIGEQEFSDLKNGGYVAPLKGTPEMKEWLGDENAWYGTSGQVAVLVDSFWTYQGIWESYEIMQSDLDIVPYPIPVSLTETESNIDSKTIATIDFGGISSSTRYPREAYELLKFMSFGIDGWKTRIEAYNDYSVLNSEGNLLKNDVMPAPITMDNEIWELYKKMFYTNMDKEHKNYWDIYFESCRNPIPYGWTNIAGYWNFCNQFFNKVGIHDIVDSGRVPASNFVQEASKQANYYHAIAMLEYFGKQGYDVLSENEITFYSKLKADNQIVIENDG